MMEEPKKYEDKFHALADRKRLMILNLLCEHGKTCVCDLSELTELPQSKLSYHLKILLDADMIRKENEGTWSYYTVNGEELTRLLSCELCLIPERKGGE
ncbi:MAG: winged helix-turn-helix transcriptional regulator [Clostridiales bacterium]|nr:winged helix-turn-helix transcriptional regulator [Clostridiales bacterium]